MAEKRMFSLKIIDTDAFLDMPMSSQLLYFHLSMRADDEGFVSSPKRIMKLIGCQDDDLKVLIAKRFILSFDSGIVVIKHWLIHNTIRADRIKKTTYQKEKEKLTLNESNGYTELCQPSVNQVSTKSPHRLDKTRLDKIRLDKESEENSPKKIANNFFNNEEDRKDKITHLVDKYNLDEYFITTEINKFISYWSELNGTGKKQRWEMEKTFEIDRRLSSWFLRAKQYNNKKSKFTSI